jgi:tetratricopeptide (TPR) repeat protein
MPPAEVLALVCGQLGIPALPTPVAELILAKAEGHPFFSEEIAFALRDTGVLLIEDGAGCIAPGVDFASVSVPDSVEEVISSRIDRLTPPQQLAIKVASIIGREFTLGLLEDIYPVEADKPRLGETLKQLQLLDLIQLETSELGQVYRFKHIITQEVAYNRLTFAQRRALHQVVAGWYERVHAGELSMYYPALAHHWGKTGNVGKTIEYSEKAGEQALGHYANREAVSFLSAALRQASTQKGGEMPAIEAYRLARWERQLGEANLRLGRHKESRLHSYRSLALLGRPIPAGRGRQALFLLGQLAGQAARRLAPPALKRLRLGKPVAEVAFFRENCLEIVKASFNIGELCYYENEWLLGLALMLQIVNLTREDEPSHELAQAYAGLALVAVHFKQAGLADLYIRLAQQTARQVGKLESRAFVQEVAALAYLRLGRLDQSESASLQAAEIFERIGDRRRWEECLSYLTEIAAARGRFTRGIEVDQQMVASARRRGDFQVMLMALEEIINFQLILCQTAEAQESIQTGLEALEQVKDDRFEILYTARLAQVYLRQSNLQLAGQTLERALRLYPDTAPALYSISALPTLASVALELWQERDQPAADRQRLLALVRKNLKEAPSDPRLNSGWLAWRLRGWEAWLSGKPLQARYAWLRSFRSAERLNLPYETGLAHKLLAQFSAGKTRQAHLLKAQEIFERLGAVYDLEQVRALV